MRLYVDDEPLLLTVAELEHYERSLSFADGVLTRELIWRTPSGKRVHLRSRRMVTFTERHLAVMDYEITMLDAAAPVVVCCQILNRQDGEDEYHVRSAAMGTAIGPAPRGETLRPGAAAACPSGTATGARARLPRHRLRHDDGRRRRPHDRDQRRERGAHPDRGRPRQARVPDPGDARCDHPDHQDRQLPHLARRARRANSSTVAAAPSTAPRTPASRRSSPEQRAWLDDFWARSDVDDRRPAGPAAGGPVEPLPARPGLRARRGRRASRPRASPVPATAGTTSGTPRSTCCRSSPTRRRTSARNALRFRLRPCSTRRGAAPPS